MRNKIHLIPIIILVILLGGLLYASTFTLDNIKINGCLMSREDSVKAAIEEEAVMGNTIMLYLKNRFSPKPEIPFVAKMDVSFEDKHTVVVDIYEKSVAGCIEYMEKYIYFDKDGIVLETINERHDGVPYIKGLTVKSWQLGQKLPIENKKKFETILNITQLVEKYDLSISGIEFTADGEVVLWHKNVEIELGDGSSIAVQLMNLGSILETDGLGEKSGVLYMKDYTLENPTASFKEK
ncbi:MAG: hypothetical protein K6E10_11545 [Eubacterium sp.]|nr:hypothetical protein [Eubacterium sp.]